jgi:Ca2+-binding EF-hand superfamily protein
VHSSSPDLDQYEEEQAKIMFNHYVEVDESDCISSDELKSLLLNLNLNLSSLLLEGYKEAHLTEIGADSSRSGDTMNWDQFRSLYILILRNQSSFFREIYNDRKIKELDIQKHLAVNEDNLKQCFRIYDIDNSGLLDYKEFVQMIQDLSLDKQFSQHLDPTSSFNNFCYQMWASFDINTDGKISFDEFIKFYNEVLDR